MLLKTAQTNFMLNIIRKALSR